MGVPADDGHARQGESLLRADDMDDALPDIVHAEQGDTERLAVIIQRLNLFGAHRIGNGDTAEVHHPEYNFNDDAIPYGASYWAELVETRMPAA